MSQKSKSEFHVDQILIKVQNIRQNQNPKHFSQLASDLDWIAFHARELETKCKGCDEAPAGSQDENDK